MFHTSDIASTSSKDRLLVQDIVTDQAELASYLIIMYRVHGQGALPNGKPKPVEAIDGVLLL